jgi:hypothetical protein
VIGDFAAVVAAGAAWVVLGATSSAEAIVVPVKTVPKTTEAKVKVCLREIVYFFKIRPLFNKVFSIIQVFEKLVNGIIIKALVDFLSLIIDKRQMCKNIQKNKKILK